MVNSLHGFRKKSQKTPSRELEIARRRHNDFLDREGRGANNMKGRQISEGAKRYQEYWDKQMANPEFRKIYEEEAAKKELWLQLVEAWQAAGLTQAELAKRLGVSQAQVACLEKRGYEDYTLNSLRRYVEASVAPLCGHWRYP
jgi:predicted XRE-type DNA-binding protein